MNIYKRILSLTLCILTVFSFIVFSPAKVDASATYDTSKLVALMKKFPNGKYWNHVGSSTNNPDGYTSTPCTHHGSGCSYSTAGACACNWYNGAIQCMGYAHKLAHDITGVDVGSSWEKIYDLDLSDLCVGDEIRYLNNRHSIVVVGVSGNTIAYTGANWGANCLIKWGTMSKSQITGFSYVYHLKTNTKKNSDFSFLKGISSGDSSSDSSDSSDDTEYWKAKDSNDAVLNVRKSFSTSSDVIDTIPAGKKFIVTSKKYWDGKYIWGEVKYNDLTGYAALNYAEYVSGGDDKVDFSNVSNIFAGTSYTLKWNAVDGANKYYVKIYSASGTVQYKYPTTKTSYTVKIPSAGTHYIEIIATNTKAPTWKITSGKQEVSVMPSKSKYITAISIPSTMVLTKGGYDDIDCDTEPSSADDDVKWQSSDLSVATVSTAGRVKGLKYGTATITAYSSKDNSIKDTCKVTVTVATPTGLKQTASGTGTSSVGVSWTKVSGASGYVVYRKTSSGYKKVKATTGTSAKITGLSVGNSYTIAVKAYKTVNGKNLLTDYSATITTKTAAKGVSSLKVTNRTTSGYTLTWSKMSGASKYMVYRYEGKSWVRISTQTSTSLKLNGEAGKAFKYTVAAVYTVNGSSVVGAKASSVWGYRAGNTTGSTTKTSKETWKAKTDNDGSINIRKEPNTDASVLGGIPAGEKFTVTKRKFDGTYVWGKVKYNGITGWAVLNYANHVSGQLKYIKIHSSTGIFPGKSYKLIWSTIPGANKYKVTIYNSSKKKVTSFTTSNNYKNIKLSSSGTYYVKIVASNSNVAKWSVSSGNIKFYCLKYV